MRTAPDKLGHHGGTRATLRARGLSRWPGARVIPSSEARGRR